MSGNYKIAEVRLQAAAQTYTIVDADNQISTLQKIGSGAWQATNAQGEAITSASYLSEATTAIDDFKNQLPQIIDKAGKRFIESKMFLGTQEKTNIWLSQETSLLGSVSGCRVVSERCDQINKITGGNCEAYNTYNCLDAATDYTFIHKVLDIKKSDQRPDAITINHSGILITVSHLTDLRVTLDNAYVDGLLMAFGAASQDRAVF